MASKEITPETAPVPQQSSILEKLKQLPGWETTPYWRKQANKDGSFIMWMHDKHGDLLEYHNYGLHFRIDTDDPSTSIEIALYDNDINLQFKALERTTWTNLTKRIEHHIIIGPFMDIIWSPDWDGGIHYGSDGVMDPIFDVPDKPQTIDTHATVANFVKQMMTGNFEMPTLVLPQR